jgi:putative protease
VDVQVLAREGSPLLTRWQLQDLPEIAVAVASEKPLESAQNRALTVELLREQMGRLGGTAYELGDVDLTTDGAPFAPVSLLNQMRRQAVVRLAALQVKAPVAEIRIPPLLATLDAAAGPVESGEPQLHLLVRTPAQMDAAIASRPASITLDYLDFYGLRPSLDRVKAAGIEARIASPRVLKPGEERIANFLLSCECPILVRPAGLLSALRASATARLDGDFSLNIANAISARMFDLGRLTPSHDLNGAQVAELARAVGAERIEAIAYQHLPVFHTEHCVFCRFLSTGTSYKDCGRPCEKHTVALRDTGGRAHSVMADVGCRNTVFGAEAQEASAHLDAWLAAGIRHFRLEFVHETPERVGRIAAAFAERLSGRSTGAALQKSLRNLAPEGVTEGSLFVPASSALLPVLQ